MMPTMRMRVQFEGRDAVAVKIKDGGSRSQSSNKDSFYRILLDGPTGKHGRKFLCYTFLIFMSALACWTVLSADAGVGRFGSRLLPSAEDPKLMKTRDIARLDREVVDQADPEIAILGGRDPEINENMNVRIEGRMEERLNLVGMGDRDKAMMKIMHETRRDTELDEQVSLDTATLDSQDPEILRTMDAERLDEEAIKLETIRWDSLDSAMMKVFDRARREKEKGKKSEIVLSPREVKIKEIEDARSEEVKLLLTRINDEVQAVLASDKPFTKFGPRITDWDAQREVARRIHSLEASRDSSNPRMILLTSSQPQSCENQRGDETHLKSFKNKMDYCRLHGVEIFYNMHKLDEEMVGGWTKVFLTHMLMLDHPEVDWILWMDSDALFTDMNFELPIDKYENSSMVMQGRDENVYDKRSSLGLNTGMFLIRNCQWSLDLLHAWASLGSSAPVRSEVGNFLKDALPDQINDEVDDQTALVWLLISQRSKWASKVYLEDSYYLQSEWRQLTSKFDEIVENIKPGVDGDNRWPFAVHFTGCQFCTGGQDGNSTQDECMTQLERAVNFANNQVIHRYGFRHTSLHSPELELRRNTSEASAPTTHDAS